jgi:hypothetical protein
VFVQAESRFLATLGMTKWGREMAIRGGNDKLGLAMAIWGGNGKMGMGMIPLQHLHLLSVETRTYTPFR